MQKSLQKKLQFAVVSLWCWLGLICFVPLSSAQSLFQFEHLTTANGLSSNLITTILQDDRGFLWFGTENGLNRYDGYDFQVYRHQPSDATSLSSNEIHVIYQDKTSALWVGTSDGLNRFDRNTVQFERFQHDPNNSQSLSHNSVKTVIEDQSGNLLIGTGQGVNRFDPQTKQFSPFFGANPPHPDLPQAEVNALMADRAGNLWIGTSDGLYQWNPQTNDVVVYEHDEQNTDNSLVDNTILSLFEDIHGTIWISIDGGLTRLNPKTGTMINNYHFEDGSGIQLVGDEVTGVLQDENGFHWIATTEGLNRYELKTDEYLAFIHDPKFADSLAHSKVKTLYIDSSGILWLGTEGGGVSRLNLKKKPFFHDQHHPENDQSLGYDSVISFWEEAQGRIWVGLDDEGFNRFDPNTGLFERFEYEAENYTGIESTGDIFYIETGGIHKDRVRSIQPNAQGNLWIGTSEGLEYFDLETIRFRHFHPKEGRPHSLSHENIQVVLLTSETSLWIGTKGGGLNHFNPQTYENEIYAYDPSNPASLSGDHVISLIQDPSGNLWIGTDGDGLNYFNLQTKTFEHFQHDPNQPQSLSNNQIWSLYQAKDQTVWIGTSNGLNRMDPSTKAFTHYGEAEGLTDPLILGILEDRQGNLWLSKQKGISKFNPTTREFHNYNAKNGLPTDQFLQGAYFQSSTGIIYLGSNQGMIYFDPAAIQNNSHVPPVVFTKLQILNQTIVPGKDSPLNVDITETKRLSLSYWENSVSFTFAALDYSNPANNQYAYRLEGFDETWNEIGDRRFVSFASLPEGEYVLTVRGSNNDGVWNETGTSIHLSISPPPWRTWWAYALYLLAIVGVIVGYSRYKTLKYEEELKAQEQAKHLLEEKVDERTKELRDTQAKVLQLEKDKTEQQMAGGFAHEMRNALVGSKIVIEETLGHDGDHPYVSRNLLNSRELKKMYDYLSEQLQQEQLETCLYSMRTIFSNEEHTDKILKMILQSTERALNITQQIMDYSKVGHEPSTVGTVQLDTLLAEQVEQFREMFQDHQIDLKLDINQKISLNGKRSHLETIVSNLLLNAKDAILENDSNKSRKITISAAVEDATLLLRVQDTGIGIAPENLLKIYEPFFSTKPETGTGLGLGMVQKMVAVYKGSIDVASEVGKGTEFTVRLPTNN